MSTYNVHVPEVRTPAQKAAALKVPLYTRSGREVSEVRSFNRETLRVVCAIEGGAEHTYDYSDLVHHLGDAGKRAHFEAAGFTVKNAHAHPVFQKILSGICS